MLSTFCKVVVDYSLEMVGQPSLRLDMFRMELCVVEWFTINWATPLVLWFLVAECSASTIYLNLYYGAHSTNNCFSMIVDLF